MNAHNQSENQEENKDSNQSETEDDNTVCPSSSEDENDSKELKQEDFLVVDQPNSLRLVDEENLLVLPPEDLGETSDEDHAESKFESSFDDLLNSVNSVKFSDDIVDESFDSRVQKKKKKRKKPYTVNLSNCKYESVRRVLRRFGFREVDDEEDWNLYWTDFSVSLDRVVVMKMWQKINHFPGMSEICRKDSLARNLNRMARLFPKDYNFFPKSWCLPSEWGELQAYARKRKNRAYILKPDTGCQGRGIFITRSAKEIRPMDNMIAQVYITKPFLIDGYKFDMRLYVLMTSCDPLRLYVFKDGLVRFTTIQYLEPNQRNLHNMYMHLTNYAVQKHSRNYVHDNEEGGTKRRITTLNRWFTDNGYDIKEIWKQVDDVVIKTVLSGYPVIRHNYKTCFPNHLHASACFEVLGFDIMFNHKLKPYVLEVNHSPSFNTDSKLDKEIKEAMLWDTLQLAHFGAVSKKKCVEEERKRIRNRLLNKSKQKEHKDAIEKETAHHQAINERYENNHCGNFRLIYPSPGTEKYGPFLSPNASFYQETMSYKVRIECARQMREEIRLKQEKLDILHNRLKQSGPESPIPRRSLSKFNVPRSNITTRGTSAHVESNPELRKTKATPILTQNQDIDAVIESNWPPEIKLPTQIHTTNLSESGDSKLLETLIPQPILSHEEAERLEGLKQREIIMRRIGLIEAVHRILSKSSGVCSTEYHGVSTRTHIELKTEPQKFERPERSNDTTLNSLSCSIIQNQTCTSVRQRQLLRSKVGKDNPINSQFINMVHTTQRRNNLSGSTDQSINKNGFTTNSCTLFLNSNPTLGTYSFYPKDPFFASLLKGYPTMSENRISQQQQQPTTTNSGDHVTSHGQPTLVRGNSNSSIHHLNKSVHPHTHDSLGRTDNPTLVKNSLDQCNLNMYTNCESKDDRFARVRNGFLPCRNLKSVSAKRTRSLLSEPSGSALHPHSQPHSGINERTENKMDMCRKIGCKTPNQDPGSLPILTNPTTKHHHPSGPNHSTCTEHESNMNEIPCIQITPLVTSLKLIKVNRVRNTNPKIENSIITNHNNNNEIIIEAQTSDLNTDVSLSVASVNSNSIETDKQSNRFGMVKW